MSWTKRASGMLLWAVYLFALAELFAWVSVRFVPKINQFFYNDQAMTEPEYSKWLEQRDPVLGWPSRNTDFDENGFTPRVLSRFGTHCISVYGDSFTYSDEVSAEKCWPNIASELLGCDVLNYGIGGYGTYQSYLRYVENKAHDTASLVVLNHMSENISRVRNQYRSLLYAGNIEGFKPTATIDESTLRHVPVPEFENYEHYRDAIRNPTASVFPYEAYLPESGFANFRLEFPYSLALLKAVFNHYKVKTMLFNVPMYEFHYQKQKDVELMLAIMQAFISEAEQNGQVPLVSLIPKCNDYEFYLKEGHFPYAPLADLLAGNDVEFLDLGMAIAQRDDFDDFHSWYGPKCGGHPNEKGYQVMAEAFASFVQVTDELH